LELIEVGRQQNDTQNDEPVVTGTPYIDTGDEMYVCSSYAKVDVGDELL